jgi:hypothetical protein
MDTASQLQDIGCPIDHSFFAIDNRPLVWTLLFLTVIAPFLGFLVYVRYFTPAPPAKPEEGKKEQTIETKKALGKVD